MSKRNLFWGLLLSLASGTCLAHTGSHPLEGFGAGITHPFWGGDHLLAMLGVGLWAAMLSGAFWRLPLVFMACMTLGGVVGAAGISVSGIETGLGASVLVLGLLLAAKARFAFPVAACLTGFLALLHGVAHGAEMAGSAIFAAYALGFVVGTGLIHAVGLLLGRTMLRVPGFLRLLGGLMSSVGVVLMLQGA